MATEAPACPEPLAANRANAAHSTGPKTAEAKARVSRNALRHGLRARLIVDQSTAPDEGARFRALLKDVVAELHPAGILEEFAVETIAVCIWRLRHTVQEELHGADMTERERLLAKLDREYREGQAANSHWMPPEPPDFVLASDQRIALLVRYEAHLMRQYRLALNDLRTLQAARLATPAQASAVTPPLASQVETPDAPPPPPSGTPAAQSALSPSGGPFPSPQAVFADQTQPSAMSLGKHPVTLCTAPDLSSPMRLFLPNKAIQPPAKDPAAPRAFRFSQAASPSS